MSSASSAPAALPASRPPGPRPAAAPPVEPPTAPPPLPTDPAAEARAALAVVYLRGDRWMTVFIALHAVLGLAMAGARGTWKTSLAVSLLAPAAFYALRWLRPGHFATRVVAGIVLQAFVALHIYQMAGLAEMHFFYFTAVTAMILYQDWRALWPGIAAIIAQHTLFSVLHNAGVRPGGEAFFEPDTVSATKLAWHYGVALAQAGIAAYAARELHDRTVRAATQRATVAEQARTLSAANAALAAQSVALDQSNQRLQEQAAELEMQASQLQEQAAELEMRNEELATSAVALRRQSDVAEAARTRAEHAAARTALLQAVTAALVGAHDEGEVARAVLAVAVPRLGARHGTLALRETAGRDAARDAGRDAARAEGRLDAPDGEPMLRIVEAHDLPADVRDAHARFPLDHPSPAAAAARDGVPRYLADPGAIVAGFPDVGALVASLHVRAIAALPILATDGPPAGTLVFDFDAPRAFDGDDRALLEAVAAQCAQALERVRAMRAQRAAEARFRVAQEVSPDGFQLMRPERDAEGRVLDFCWTYVNEAGARTLGRPAAALVGRGMRALYPGTDDTGLFARYVRVLETGEPMLDEVQVDVDGVTGGFRVAAVRLGDGLAISYADISDRLRAEEALRESEARFRTLADAMPQLVWTARADGAVDWYNQRWLDFTGLSAETLAGDGWRAVQHPDHRDEVVRRWAHAVATGTPFEIEMPLRGRDGRWRWFLTRGRPLVGDDGRVTRWFGTNTDVTEAREAREERERLLAAAEAARAQAEHAQREAEAANLAKSRFLASMSHELRTPLNAVGGYAQLMAMGIRGPVTPDQLADLERIRRSSEHLLSLINDILQYAKLEAGQLRMDVRDVPLHPVLAELETLVGPQLQARRLAYRYQGCAASLVARADRERLVQVLLNLLTNAVKYTEPDGAIEVWCETLDAAEAAARPAADPSGAGDGAPHPAGPLVAIHVRDTGIGIPLDMQRKVFDPFVQVRRTFSAPEGGVGLGLSISRDLARAMHGELSLASTPGAGSTFTLWLPLAPEATPPGAPDAALPAGTDPIAPAMVREGDAPVADTPAAPRA